MADGKTGMRMAETPERWDYQRWGALPELMQAEILAVLVNRLGGDVTITDAELAMVRGRVFRWTDPAGRALRFTTEGGGPGE